MDHFAFRSNRNQPFYAKFYANIMNTVNILEEKKFTLSQILHSKLLISLLFMSIQALFSEKGHISRVYLFLIEC